MRTQPAWQHPPPGGTVWGRLRQDFGAYSLKPFTSPRSQLLGYLLPTEASPAPALISPRVFSPSTGLSHSLIPLQ